MRLLVDESASAAFLAFGGEPVWPARTAGELDILKRIVQVMGGELQLVRGACVEPRAREGAVVVALADEVEQSARLYAHLTRRGFTRVGHISELEHISPDVVFVPYRHLDTDLLHEVARPRGGRVTGLIAAESSKALHQQTLIRAAAVEVCGPIVQRHIEISTTEDTSGRSSDEDHIYRDADVGQVERGLRSGAGILTLDQHSDGLDADLGPSLTLCPMDRIPSVHDERRRPRCIATGQCYRRRKTLAAALASGELLPPEVVAARVLIWNTCRGLLMPRGETDVHWGLAARLLASPTLGAIILPWDSVPGDLSTESLADYLALGMPVGEALAKYLESPVARTFEAEMCLFGDPRVRAVLPLESNIGRQNRAARIAVPVQASLEHTRDLGLLVAAASAYAKTATAEQRLESVGVSRLLREFELSIWSGSTSGFGDRSTVGGVRRSALRYLLRRHEFVDDWGRYSVWTGSSASNRRCGVCGERVRVFHANLRIPNTANRRVVRCPCCDLIEDSPSDLELTLNAVGPRAVALRGPMPEGRWAAGVLTNAWGRTDMWLWPVQSDGSPLPVAVVPGDVSDAPTRVAVYLILGVRVIQLVVRLPAVTGKERGRAESESPLEGQLLPFDGEPQTVGA